VTTWTEQLRVNPIPALSASGDPALVYFVQRDLCGQGASVAERTEPIESLWELPEAERILRRQRHDGAWKYPSRRQNAHESENYDLLQTYRMLGILIEQYGMDRRHPAIARAAAYLFSHQAPEGDIRGIFGSQYAPHYTAGMMELLIRAGYEADPRIERAFQWYLSIRQDDGGWAWPLHTANVSYHDAIEQPHPVETDKSKPFSHALTGFVLRAFAAHPGYRKSAEARGAGEGLKSRFFKADKYPDRRAAHYWTKFQFPFWWANLLTSLDSLSWIGFSPDDADIQSGLAWFVSHQEADGLWPTSYGKGRKAEAVRLWVGLAVCRVCQRLYA
jgi:hypothetical protein